MYAGLIQRQGQERGTGPGQRGQQAGAAPRARISRTGDLCQGSEHGQENTMPGPREACEGTGDMPKQERMVSGTGTGQEKKHRRAAWRARAGRGERWHYGKKCGPAH